MFGPKKTKEQSFTLIEILLVITVIGIISGLAFVGMAAAADQARIAKARVFSHSIEENLSANGIGEYNGRVEKVYSDIFLRDDSSSRTDGYLWNGSATSSDTPFGPRSDQVSISFDGNDDYVRIPQYNSPVGSLKPTDQLTVSAFFKMSDYTLGGWWSTIVSARDFTSGEAGYAFGVKNTGQLYGRIAINGYGPGNLEVTGSSVISNNKWYHAALTYSKDDRKAIVYLDGKKDGEASLDAGYSGDACIFYRTPSNGAAIGDDPGISGKIFKGLIYNVQVYNTKFQSQ